MFELLKKEIEAIGRGILAIIGVAFLCYIGVDGIALYLITILFFLWSFLPFLELIEVRRNVQKKRR